VADFAGDEFKLAILSEILEISCGRCISLTVLSGWLGQDGPEACRVGLGHRDVFDYRVNTSYFLILDVVIVVARVNTSNFVVVDVVIVVARLQVVHYHFLFIQVVLCVVLEAVAVVSLVEEAGIVVNTIVVGRKRISLVLGLAG